MYLCPLGILIAFSIGVLILSIILPRIRERGEARLGESVGTLFSSVDIPPSKPKPVVEMSGLFSEGTAEEAPEPLGIDDLDSPEPDDAEVTAESRVRSENETKVTAETLPASPLEDTPTEG
jgi:hypothetical protein